MAWYWWVLIAVGVAVIGYVKLKIWGQITASMKAKREREQAMRDE